VLFPIPASAVKAQHSGYSVPDMSFPQGRSHRGTPSSLELRNRLMKPTLSPTAYERESVL